jgi:hypothetical protein
MKKILFLLCIFIIKGLAISQTLDEVASIDMDYTTLKAKYNYKTTEIMLANKKSMGKYTCFEMNDILAPYIKELKEQDKAQLIIISETSDGQQNVSSYYDFTENVNILVPFIIFQQQTGGIGDTVYIRDVPGHKGKVDTRLVDEEYNQAVLHRVYLQLKSVTKEEKDRIFKPGTIIFPQDKTPARWIGNVKRIRLLLVKK